MNVCVFKIDCHDSMVDYCYRFSTRFTKISHKIADTNFCAKNNFFHIPWRWVWLKMQQNAKHQILCSPFWYWLFFPFVRKCNYMNYWPYNQINLPNTNRNIFRLNWIQITFDDDDHAPNLWRTQTNLTDAMLQLTKSDVQLHNADTSHSN